MDVLAGGAGLAFAESVSVYQQLRGKYHFGHHYRSAAFVSLNSQPNEKYDRHKEDAARDGRASEKVQR